VRQKQFPWGVIPRHVDPLRIRKLVVDHTDDAVDLLPGVIGDLSHLIWLDIPRRFVSKLRAGSLPPRLHTLRIAGGGTAALPKALVLPDLKKLLNHRDGMLRFAAGQVAGVRYLSVKLDPRGMLLREVAQMSNVCALEACPISGRDVLETLVKLPLRYLKASRGHLDTIEPLLECPGLTNLWLEDLMRLTSIAPLAGLPALRELMVTYCSKLRLDRSLLRMPALRQLNFFACKDIGMTAVRPEMEALGLDYFIASGTW
jgi:hypothetical protein